ncbi:polyprenyl diphosphate synthase [Streptomyces sp. NPDC048564]|uniref:polyprenyl diphosphate synthase n=1 Tax=Streptomyces sp. NPDC048564 TaxID=3155760 RepID=UPI00343BF086
MTSDDPSLQAAYRLCRRQTKEQDPAQYALIRLVPATLRPACWALWAAANAIDDLADDRTANTVERAALVEEWITALDQELDDGTSSDPIRHALVDTALRWCLDLSRLHGAMLLVRDDAHGRHFPDWPAWRAWARDNLVPWFDLLRDLFDRAGVPVALRMDNQEVYEQFLDGLRLTDTLTDLSADLAQHDLLLPDEVLDQHPGAADDLMHRRWSPPVAEMINHLTGLARQWVNQPLLTRGMHPAPATICHTMSALLRSQLDAVTSAGPTVLHTPPRPSPLTSARILAPAQARAALAWSLTPVSVPPPNGAVQRRPPGLHRGVPRSTFRTPTLHPSGERHPKIPAGQMPTHVAVIMDGNGRWAQQRGLPRHEGHRAGAAAVRETVYGALEIGLRHLTLYALSTENWKRGAEEIHAILDLLHSEVRANPFQDLDVRLRWHGGADRLPADLVDLLRLRERSTRTRTALTLTMCINYGGRDEITRTAAALARSAARGQLDPDLISEKDFAQHLPHPDMPDVDLLWRTGNEQRTSNFLPWHTTYAELYFTPNLWPDTDRRDLWHAVTEYSRRRRRHGATPDLPERASHADEDPRDG